MKKRLPIFFAFLAILNTGFAYCPGTNFYLKCLNGVNLIEQTNLDDGEAKFATGYMGALALGYNVDTWFISRVEVEFAGRNNELEYVVGLWGERYLLDGRTQSYSFFANAYYDIYNLCGFTPYVGYGYGYSFLSTRFSGKTFDLKGSNSLEVQQFIGGVKTSLTPCLDLSLEYRYFLGRKIYREQNIGVAFTLKI